VGTAEESAVRLTVVFDKRRQDFNRIRPHDELVMIGADVLGDASCVMKLAEVLFIKTDRKRFDALASTPGSSTPRPALESMPPERNAPERHLRHQTHAHRLAQDLDSALTSFFLADV
jgi:hypothetical protein